MLTDAQAWRVLQQVSDPEIPVISVCDLGIVREVRATPDRVTVVLTPTYSGCPATEMIEASIRAALLDAGAQTVNLEKRLSPAWTTDWIAPAAAETLRASGIVPPHPANLGDVSVLRFVPPAISCPRCGSQATERVSQFGSTACKALYRCVSCREPFEYIKPI
jgi:ring-1,2-phenylacetyl-CoA epoxidase subunit PaaD